ncbi:hypothetical protein QJS04_geneDACA010882 [Acorus gramineus]|uniref:Uncharacterized protein n=1 Tax=Acorus gramineus TaxID=55184 RepID=A0AAV9BBV4_ACOGR|nr:hypothetical protein QJS04_geneDACA010882 [Acorus gramineus]
MVVGFQPKREEVKRVLAPLLHDGVRPLFGGDRVGGDDGDGAGGEVLGRGGGGARRDGFDSGAAGFGGVREGGGGGDCWWVGVASKDYCGRSFAFKGGGEAVPPHTATERRCGGRGEGWGRRRKRRSWIRGLLFFG